MSAQEEHRCIAWRRAASPLPEALAGALARRGISPDIETDRFGALAAVLLAHRSGRLGAESRGDHVPPTILLLIEPEELAGVASVVRAAESYAPGAVCWAFESRANPALRAVTPSDLERWESPASVPTSRGRADPLPQEAGVEPARDLPATSEPGAGEPDAAGLGEDFQPGVVEVLSGRTFVRRAAEERGARDARTGSVRPLPPLRLAGEGPIGPLGVNSDPSAAELGGDTPGVDPASGLLTAEELEMLLADDEDARGHG